MREKMAGKMRGEMAGKGGNGRKMREEMAGK